MKTITKQELARILENHGKWLQHEEGGIRAYLEGADLCRANLEGANLEGANLSRANLSRADLRRANLRRANLKDTNLIAANLVAANLEGANLGGANLSRANLGGANLSRANLEYTNLIAANLGGANLEGANLEGVDLCRANLGDANLTGASILNEGVIARPVTVSPVGSNSGTLEVWPTKKGLIIRRGCFAGTKKDFLKAVSQRHAENDHALAYEAALEMAEASLRARGVRTTAEETAQPAA